MGIAADTTTPCNPSGRASSVCGTATEKPSPRSFVTAALSSRSDPVTTAPRAAHSRASPDMPLPPMPTKCRRCPFRSGAAGSDVAGDSSMGKA